MIDKKKLTMLRGRLRGVWNRWPTKIEFIKAHRFMHQFPGKKKKQWALRCAICNIIHKQANISIDHVEPAGSLLTEKDITPFILRLLFVADEGLQPLCKVCHDRKTYCEKMGCTWEEEPLYREVARVTKLNKAPLVKWMKTQKLDVTGTLPTLRERARQHLLGI